MSDPLSTVDIEDVLASIRRLVLEGRPESEGRAGDGRAPSGKLVLTPALRVAEGAPVLVLRPEGAPAAGHGEPAGDVAPEPPAPEEPPVFRRSRPAAEAAPRRPEPAPADPADDPLDDPGDLLDEPPRRADARDAAPGPALGVDEATLRAIVAAVLRQELQGELGERVTRNVRKLVRREIFRVLSSQDES